MKETVGLSITSDNQLFQFLYINDTIKIIHYEYKTLIKNNDGNEYKFFIKFIDSNWYTYQKEFWKF